MGLALMATVEAAPATANGAYGGPLYFENNLDGIQGALMDISAAGTDLDLIKGKLGALLMVVEVSTPLKLLWKLLSTALLTPTLSPTPRPLQQKLHKNLNNHLLRTRQTTSMFVRI